ncbi:hypothetical protein TNCV_428021 [Trichonephila clavipes]|nr:hypothetical protein TNCV_428021 [Trichonephila clavipes]
MRARNYYAHHNTRDHWTLRCKNRCPDLVVCLKRDLQCLRPEASLVLIYRPNVAGMEGRVDPAQPVNRTPDLCYTRAFGDGPRNFEPWSSDVNDTRAGTPSPNYPTTPMGGRFSSRQI